MGLKSLMYLYIEDGWLLEGCTVYVVLSEAVLYSETSVSF
jgi:hypothetical protein